MIRIVFLISTLIVFFSLSAQARDFNDAGGGFGASFTGSTPPGLSQPSPAVLAKYNDPSVADIEPAAGDEEAAVKTGDDKVEKQTSPSGAQAKILQPASVPNPSAVK